MKINLVLFPLLIAATLLGCDNDTEKKAMDAAHNANESVKDAAHEAKENMQDAADEVKQKAGEAADAMREEANKAKAATSDAGGNVELSVPALSSREKQEAEAALKK